MKGTFFGLKGQQNLELNFESFKSNISVIFKDKQKNIYYLFVKNYRLIYKITAFK